MKYEEDIAATEVSRLMKKAEAEGKKFSPLYYKKNKKAEAPSTTWIAMQHGGWAKALDAMGYGKYDRNTPLLAGRKHLAHLIKTRGYVTKNIYDNTRDSSMCSSRVIVYDAGSWTKAVNDLSR